MIELDADAVGILEQDRIIARCPRLFPRTVDKDDVGPVLEEGMNPVDRVAVAQAETDVVEPGAP